MRILALAASAAFVLTTGVFQIAQQRPAYRIEVRDSGPYHLRERFTAEQLALLEKLNRADAKSLEGLPQIVLPESWDGDELYYSPLPVAYSAAASNEKLLVVHFPGQVFGGYAPGRLVRWGPVSSGKAISPTSSGSYHLNWRSAGRASTVNPDWFMRWYFNFGNEEGLAFHEYELPGLPASHGCIRLLQRDAMWLHEWGDGWRLNTAGQVVSPGTPVSIQGSYDFNAPPPWRSLEWLKHEIVLTAP